MKQVAGPNIYKNIETLIEKSAEKNNVKESSIITDVVDGQANIQKLWEGIMVLKQSEPIYFV